VSIADEVRAAEPRPGEPGSGEPRAAERPADRQFDRTPPQDVAAEQCVLGGMMLSKDAIADVVEILRGGDFYRPVHTTIFEAVLDLYGRGEPADPITVAAALADTGELGRVGGAPYLHTLISSVPTAANAAYYARIVAERAVLRRLVEAGTRIVQLGYGVAAGGGRDVDDIVDLAQQVVYDVTERRVSEDFAVLAELLQPTLDEIEAVGAQGGVMTGLPTGFTDLDRLLNGLHPGQLIVVAGRPGLGKALALDTPLPTPDGWTTMGEVQVGNLLIGADGRPTTVVTATAVMLGRPCYEVELSDGTVIVADAEHRWVTETRLSHGSGTGPMVRTTEEISATVRGNAADTRPNHSISNCQPLALPTRRLLIPPYTLGLWLGGDHRDRRRIPPAYLRASEPQRRALLAGLLDPRATVSRTGTVQFTSTCDQLAHDVYELIVGLGYRCTMTRTATAHLLRFSTVDDVFQLERKRLLHKERRRAISAGRTVVRHVVDVRPVPSVPVRCVQVDNANHLYLAGRSMVPTHNSTAAMDFARSASVRHNLASAIFSLEMSKVEIVMRLLAAESRVPLHVLRSGHLSDDDWTKLARRMGEISEAPLYVDDTPNMTLMEIRAKARRLRQRHDLKLIIVDYLQLMTSPKRVESRQQEVAELSRGLKLLAKELECPVVAVSQLNRGPEQRTDKRPQLSDLRESGCLTAATRVLRADTNTEVALGDLLASGARDIPVWALDERLKLVVRPMARVFPSGTKDVFRLRLASGKEIEATANHPFLTFDGWTPLGELTEGARVAVPRHIPPPSHTTAWSDSEVILLAQLIGRRNPIAEWLDTLGLFGRRSHEKFIPAAVFSLPKPKIAVFLRHLWATDGSVTLTKNGGGRIYYGSTSRQLLEGVAMLLLRFGITARLRTVRPIHHRPQHTLDVSGREDQVRFLREIGVHGERGLVAKKLLECLDTTRSNTNVDTIPRQVWTRVREIHLERGMSHRQFASAIGTQFCGSTLWKHACSRQRLARIAAVLDAADLDLHATNDVFWDEVVAIEHLGPQEVYDATVAGLHNFIANGIAVHNSIEQDADVVILLHRDDYYDKESPRAGEADFIVAKHRNGPTDTVTVAAQLHLSRFVDMAVV